MDRTLNPLPHLPRPTKTYHRALYDRIRPDRPELSVRGKTVLVTGAAGGVGSAVCNAFAKAGIARISAVGRTLKSLEKLKEDIEARHPETKITPHVADMTDHVAIGAAVRKSGKIDFVVNVAVFVHDVAPPSHVNHEQVVKCFETNTFGPLNLVKCIIAEREFKGYTHDMKFIYISTALSHTSIRRLTGYAASKAAFNHFIKDLSAQWKDRGIHFFSCHPGLFFTEIMKKLWLEHEIVWDDAQLPGAFCVWLCSPEASFLSGKMTWAQWDVDELLAKKEWVEKEDYNLEIGVNAPPDAEDNKDPWDAEP